MTIGERIALLRKENNLSQEAFGESLNVSRQAISKWESDASIPDVDNLIAMSKKYNVSVGWILCAEERQEKTDGEPLSDTQLAMVKEIVHQYIEALPKPKEEPEPAPPKKRRRWLKVLLASAAVIAVIWGVSVALNLYSQINNKLDYLQSNLFSVSSKVDNQQLALANRVEELLKAQNSLLADYGAVISGCNLEAGTVDIDIYAVPRAYTEGMSAAFTVNSGDDDISVAGEESEGHRFSAVVTCPLTDDISVSAVLKTGDVTQTQLLENFERELSRSRLEFYGNAQTVYGSSLEELQQGWWDPYLAEYIPYLEQVHLYTTTDEYPVEFYDTTVTAENIDFYVIVNGGIVKKVAFEENGTLHDNEAAAYHAQFSLDFQLNEGDKLDYVYAVTDSCGRTYATLLEHYEVNEYKVYPADYESYGESYILPAE